MRQGYRNLIGKRLIPADETGNLDADIPERALNPQPLQGALDIGTVETALAVVGDCDDTLSTDD